MKEPQYLYTHEAIISVIFHAGGRKWVANGAETGWCLPLEVNALECHAEQHAEYHGAVVEVGSCAYVCEGLFPSYKMQRVAFLFATCKGLKKRGVQK